MGVGDFIYTLLKNVIIIFIILFLFNLIIPKGNIKRYANFVMGLLIIIVVISPFTQILGSELELDTNVFNYSDQMTQSDEEILEMQNKEIEILYTEKISDKITYMIDDKTPYKVSNISVDIYTDDEKYGLIKNIDIFLGTQIEEEKSDNEIKVEDIHIGEIDDQEIEGSQSYEYNELTKEISNEFSISEEVINIHILD